MEPRKRQDSPRDGVGLIAADEQDVAGSIDLDAFRHYGSGGRSVLQSREGYCRAMK